MISKDDIMDGMIDIIIFPVDWLSKVNIPIWFKWVLVAPAFILSIITIFAILVPFFLYWLYYCMDDVINDR